MSKNEALEIVISGGPKEPLPQWFKVSKAVHDEAYEIFRRAGLTGKCPLRAINPIINGVMPGQGMRIKQVLNGDQFRGERVWGITFEAQPFDRDSCWIWLHRLDNGTDPGSTAAKLKAAIESLKGSEKSGAPMEMSMSDSQRQYVESVVSTTFKDPETVEIMLELLYGEDEVCYFGADDVRKEIRKAFPSFDDATITAFLAELVRRGYLVYGAAKKAYTFGPASREPLAPRDIIIPEGGFTFDEPAKEPPKAKASAPKPTPKPQAPKVVQERVRVEPPRAKPVVLKPQPMAHFKIQLNKTPPAPAHPDIFKRTFGPMDIGDEERKLAAERADIITRDVDYTARILRYILSHREWSTKHPAVIEKGYVLDAIECAYPDIVSRNDAGIILKRFLARGHFEEFRPGVNAYVIGPFALKALTLSDIKTPFINEVHTKKPEPPKSAPPPVNPAMAEALKTWKPPQATEPVTAKAPTPIVAVASSAPIAGDARVASYMRVIRTRADENWEVTREVCLEQLEQLESGAGKIFDSLVDGGHLMQVVDDVYELHANWRVKEKPALQVAEASAVRQAAETSRHTPAPKADVPIAQPNKDLADMFARIQRGKAAKDRLVAIDAEMPKLNAEVHRLSEEIGKQNARLKELMDERAQAQSYLSSAEHREAVEYVSRELNQLKGLDSH